MSRRDVMKWLATAAAGTWMGCGGQERQPSMEPLGLGGSRRPIQYLRTNWSRDPFSLGSYSYVSKNSPGTGEGDREIVERPVGERVFFAGEALNPGRKVVR